MKIDDLVSYKDLPYGKQNNLVNLDDLIIDLMKVDPQKCVSIFQERQNCHIVVLEGCCDLTSLDDDVTKVTNTSTSESLTILVIYGRKNVDAN